MSERKEHQNPTEYILAEFICRRLG